MTDAMPNWAHFEHEAGIFVQGTGKTIEAAFEGAAMALTAVVTDPGSVQLRARLELQCQAPTLDSLLLDWLDALIDEMTTRGMLFGDSSHQTLRQSASAASQRHAPARPASASARRSTAANTTPADAREVRLPHGHHRSVLPTSAPDAK